MNEPFAGVSAAGAAGEIPNVVRDPRKRKLR